MGASTSKSLPSQQLNAKGSVSEPFSFMRIKGDTKGTWINYRPAQISKGAKWFVFYSYHHEGKWHRFKVYEEINRIKDPYLKEIYAKELQEAVNIALEKGFNPFFLPELKADKVWTINQSIAYFKQKLPERNLRKRSIQTYESAIRMTEKYFSSNESLELFTKQKAENILNLAKKELSWSGSTYNNNLTILRTMWNWFISIEIAKNNPFKGIKPLTSTPTKNHPIDKKSWEKIKSKADAELLSFLSFLYYTGTRPAEANQLTYDNIITDRQLLFIPGSISKNKKDDFIPISKELCLKGEGKIFGKSTNYFSKKFLALRKELNLPENINLYSIKHTRAVHLAEDGASPYAIMQLFRHSSIDITMTYLRGLGVNIGREAADKARNL